MSLAHFCSKVGGVRQFAIQPSTKSRAMKTSRKYFNCSCSASAGMPPASGSYATFGSFGPRLGSVDSVPLVQSIQIPDEFDEFHPLPMSHFAFGAGSRACWLEGRMRRSRPIVKNSIDFKEVRHSLKFWPQLLDVKYPGTRVVQFPHDGRRSPILRTLVEAQ